MLEMVLVSSLMTMVVACMAALTIGSLRCYDRASAALYTDRDAVSAMQLMITDVREAKSITILDPGPDTGSRLRVILPVKKNNKHYNRHEADDANSIEYYLSNSSGDIGKTGTWFWRAQSGQKRPLKQDVDSLEFDSDTSKSVKMTVGTQNTTPTGKKKTRLTQRVVYLRNY